MSCQFAHVPCQFPIGSLCVFRFVTTQATPDHKSTNQHERRGEEGERVRKQAMRRMRRTCITQLHMQSHKEVRHMQHTT